MRFNTSFVKLPGLSGIHFFMSVIDFISLMVACRNGEKYTNDGEIARFIVLSSDKREELYGRNLMDYLQVLLLLRL